MSLPDPVAPRAMVAEFNSFCRAARANGSGLYGQLLRENVADALRASFPLFTDRIGSAALEAEIDAFLLRHQGTRPQFHHIATEFLLFFQRHGPATRERTALLEYEWALLAAEIDPAAVPLPFTTMDDIALNPTTRLVLLRFDPARPTAAGGGVDRPHAIFRTADHQVLTLALTLPDCLVIEHVREVEAVPSVSLFDALDPYLSLFELQTSLARGFACGLFCPPHKTIGDPA
ncbi:putative DNA-binding domain-containing protein [Sphingomonas sp.]|uniref:HvfC/BufC family peptide modification chaperone n=1 Tax=Sphingomonas sp. TaxID=28214 RepID=UPI0028AC13C5|nr:putative DNA-binding domain-containing protein [Sphingomonas sp.]